MLAFAAPGNAVITSKESEAREKEVTSWSGYRLVSNKGTLLFSPPVPEWFMPFFITFNALHGMTPFCFNLPTPRVHPVMSSSAYRLLPQRGMGIPASVHTVLLIRTSFPSDLATSLAFCRDQCFFLHQVRPAHF